MSFESLGSEVHILLPNLSFLHALLESLFRDTQGQGKVFGFCGKWQIGQSSSARAARVSVAGDAAALSATSA